MRSQFYVKRFDPWSWGVYDRQSRMLIAQGGDLVDKPTITVRIRSTARAIARLLNEEAEK